MKTPNIKTLAELAEKATPGPLTACNMVHAETGEQMTPEQVGEYVKTSLLVYPDNHDYLFVSCTVDGVDVDYCHVGNGPNGPNNAAFIAACSRETIIAIAKQQERLVEALELLYNHAQVHMKISGNVDDVVKAALAGALDDSKED